MSKTTHTPGPWHTGEKNKYTIYCKFGQRVANAFDNIPVSHRSEAACEANARLIAAAPELLEALKEIQSLDGRNAREVAAAAIAKATGASQ